MKPIQSAGKLLLFFLLLSGNLFAQTLDSTEVDAETQRKIDSFEASINYQHGKVNVKDFATLNLPVGYKFIPADKAQMIIHDVWGNPGSSDYLGMIVKEDYKVLGVDNWAFVVTYDESGYVKDDDADDIDYDEMKKNIQESEEEENKERNKQGYPSVHFIDWAAKPYYDKQNKVLHWAKKLQFGTEPEPTLNYDVRILGRKGVLSFNAVGGVNNLADIDKNIPAVVKIATFNDGSKYSDFNPSVDKVAAYTIGGLIAGKLIAKTGFLLLLLKNIKLIALAIFGGFAAFRKKIAGWFGRKKAEEPATGAPVDQMAFLDTPTTEKTDTDAASDAPADNNTTTDSQREANI